MSERAASLGVLDTILARTRETVAREKARRPLDGSHPDVTARAEPCGRSPRRSPARARCA